MAHACFECRTENADGATFCRACGVPLAALTVDLPESDSPQALRCEDCGHRNPAGSTYCERCGYGLVALLSLGAAPAAPVTASTATPAPTPAPETQDPPSEGAPTLAPPLPAAWRSAAAPDEDTFDPLSAPTLVMSHTAPSPLPPLEPPMAMRRGPRPLRWVAAALGLLALFALLAWLVGPSAPPAAMETAPAPAAAPASAAEPAAPPLPASSPEPVMSAPAPASAALPALAAAPASAPAPAAPARKQVPEPVARKRALEAPAARSEPAPASAPAPSAPAPIVAAPPAAPPERAKTVAELCAGSNLLTRGFCEQRECRKADLATDPACVKLRDAEQRRMFQQ